MQWDIVLGLQNEDTLQKWALAQQGADRWKACELVIKHREGDAAHTWTLKKAYVHLLEEVEFPQEGTAGGATDTGYFTHAVIRGVLQQAEDYTGDNVMTVNPGGPEALPA